MNIHLVVIDPQVDFCDSGGALYVTGADEDIKRLSGAVTRLKDSINRIHCTLDNHHLADIAHPLWWKDRSGDHPEPFTIIEADALESGEWTTANPDAQARSFDYVRQLAANDRYPLCIWPPHCLIGSPGANVMPELFQAFREWEADRHGIVNFITKGSNPWTEHYSAVQADVPDPSDPGTLLNTSFIRALEEADLILLTGEAGSHCVANTARDIAVNFTDASSISKLVLLEDATSPVPGFENFQTDFIKDLTDRGMQLSTTAEILG